MRRIALAVCLLVLVAAPARALKVGGSTTVNPVAAEVAELLRAEKGLKITVDTQGGSSGGIAGVASGSLDVGMCSRHLTKDDNERFPGVYFYEVPIGYDAVALVVSRDVVDGGVRGLTREQLRGIYEGRIKSWKEVGGADVPIVFFDKEPGRGTWEVFAAWLYGSPDQAPDVTHPGVAGNDEGRTKVATTRGAITQLSAAWAEGDERLGVLAVEGAGGAMVLPSAAEVASRRYPMARPLLLLTNGAPGGNAATFIEAALSERGQEIVRKHGYLPLASVMPVEAKKGK